VREFTLIDTIHIVDDDCTVRAAISFLLTSHGYATQIYSSGSELLGGRRLRTGCILLDLRMDGKSGLDVLEELERRASHNPVIAMSGYDDIGAIVQSMKLGAVDFVKKPYDPRELLVAIDRVNGSAQRRAQERGARSEAEGRLGALSPRGIEVLRGLIAGLTNKEIALRLELSPRTVEMHRLNMIRDLGLRTTSSAIRLALLAGLEPFDEENVLVPPSAEALAPLATPRAIGRGASPCRGALEEILPPALDVIEGATDGVMLLDHDFNITYLNRNAYELLGKEPELVGENIWASFPGAARTRAFDELEVAAKHRKAGRFGFFEPDLGRWFEVSARPVPRGLQVFFRDQSRERSTFAELKRSEENLRLALEAAGDAAWDWDIRAGLITISASFVCQLGYENWKGQGVKVDVVRRLIHPFDRPQVSARLEEHLAGRAQNFAYEYRIRRSGGGWMWCLAAGRIVARDPETGEPTRMVGTVSDIGWLKEIRVRADEARELIVLAREGGGVGTWDLDLRRRHVRMCPRARKMHGIEPIPEEMPESVWEARIDPADVTGVKTALEHAIATGSTYSQRYCTILPGGERCWVFALGRPVADEGGAPTRFVGIVLDETERELAAQRLRAAQDELAHIYRITALGPVASNLAHELNQPLTALRNYASGLRRALARQSPDFRKAVTEAADGVEMSATLASRIVDRACKPAHWARVDRHPETITRLATDAAELFRDNPIDVELAIEADADRVSVDRLQIQQLLVNLIRNAADAMQGTRGRRVIVSASQRSRSETEVRICDEGPGIDPEVSERLFAPFVTTKPNGTGIGLAICRAIVEAHGGRIWVERSPLGGATIAFTLPIAEGD
jgi:two-component system sensor kinase FixL